jgi:hypothetical protein
MLDLFWKDPMTSDIIIRRLAFVRYLYSVAAGQSSLPEPLSSASILTFHDSIELFLQLATEHLNIGSQNPGFMDYFELIDQKLTPKSLSHKESIRRLNKSRVALKHHGTLPSRYDIEAFRGNATSFFEENTLLVFDLEFSSVSMTSLVSCSEARLGLDDALLLMKANQLEEALTKITIAFHQVLNDFETTKHAALGKSPFFFGTSFSSIRVDDIVPQDRKLARFLEKLSDSVQSMQSAIKILSLGLDYRNYVIFRSLAPSVAQSMSGIFRSTRFPRKIPLSIEECRFCFDFVIDSALRLQQADFALPQSSGK